MRRATYPPESLVTHHAITHHVLPLQLRLPNRFRGRGVARRCTRNGQAIYESVAQGNEAVAGGCIASYTECPLVHVGAVLILSRFARASTDEPKIGPWARAVVELSPETGGDLQAIAAARSPEA